ncbi:ADP-ribose pyrophosphatase [Ruminococcaceae bacterium YRB3002]|nr:ADP-ribose pyrophosphatase [Ruminococcaceae bacterium YRB3002]
MATIHSITKLTDKKYVNLYELDGMNSKGYKSHYLIASRSDSIEGLKLISHRAQPDAVAIYAVCDDKVVLVKQYRYAINGWIYELPAGLVEDGEDYHDTAVREMKEETGMELQVIKVDPMIEKAGFTSVGMTDEATATVYGYASGEITNKFEEASEEIEVVLADKEECRRILKEETVAVICQYQLMHFIADEKPFGFLDSFKQ